MTEEQKNAVLRLERECGATGGFDKYGAAMKQDVKKALIGFCEQDEEFAQAVVQGGSFADCMKAVGKCVRGNAISDMEAYGAAVAFYFPGAKINVSMSIDLVGDAKSGGKEGGIILDLADFFGV